MESQQDTFETSIKKLNSDNLSEITNLRERLQAVEEERVSLLQEKDNLSSQLGLLRAELERFSITGQMQA